MPTILSSRILRSSFFAFALLLALKCLKRTKLDAAGGAATRLRCSHAGVRAVLAARLFT